MAKTEEKPTTDEQTAAAPEADETAAEPKTRAGRIKAGLCVVDDGTPHTGRAVNGLICSRHAMHYKADGTPRDDQ